MVGERVIHESRWLTVRQEDFSIRGGSPEVFTYVDHPGSVFVVPRLADGRLVLIRSYRYTIDEWCWEVPAGSLGGCQGRTPQEVARAELEEETGGRARALVSLGRFYLGNGHSSLRAHFFLAEDVVLESSRQRLERSEMIDAVEPVRPEKVLNMIAGGQLADGDSALAVLLALGAVGDRYGG